MSDASAFKAFVTPALLGFALGFLGSVPIAGPTSAIVLKSGLQGEFKSGRTIALGSAMAESVYAGVAFYGFSSFVSRLDQYMPYFRWAPRISADRSITAA